MTRFSFKSYAPNAAHLVLLSVVAGCLTGEAASAPLPAVPGRSVSAYATVVDPITIAFASDGRLFVGRDNAGSGGGNNDAVKIHVVPPFGGNAAEYGSAAIVDPDAVMVDETGAISGVAGSVLVGGVAVPGSSAQGQIKAVHPDEAVVSLFGPTSTFVNPQDFEYDGAGRLLFTDFNAAKVFVTDGGPVTPLVDGAFGLRDLAIAQDGRIFTRNANTHVIQINSADGSLIDLDFASGIDGNGMAFGPGGSWGTDLYVMDGDSLVRLDSDGNPTTIGTGFGTNIQDISFGPGDALYVSDFNNDRILRIASTSFGAVALYPLNGDGTDISGNGRHGTVIGATATFDRFGNANGAMAFDGLDDWIRARGDGLPEGERTVALWFLGNQYDNHPVLLGYGGHFCGDTWFMGIHATAYGPGPYVSGHCGVNTLLYSTQNPLPGVWYHWAITTDASGTRMYLNGYEVINNATFVNDTWTLDTDLAIGVDVSPQGTGPYVDTNVSYWDGVLDDVRIYDRSLTAAEIAILANRTNGVGPPGLGPFSLDGLAPNPARGSFQVAFTLSAAGRVMIDLLDVAGRRVRSSAFEHSARGSNSVWFNAGIERSGLYWIRLSQAGRTVARRIALLR